MQIDEEELRQIRTRLAKLEESAATSAEIRAAWQSSKAAVRIALWISGAIAGTVMFLSSALSIFRWRFPP